MTVEEIFTTINSHMITGIMLHDQLAEYYDFLNLHGYKRCHEFHALEEFATRRSLVRYYINHYNKLLPDAPVEDPRAIPGGWRSYERKQVDVSTKKRAIRDGMALWEEWENKTKSLYEKSYTQLCELGEIAAACKIKELVADVDQELKVATRKSIELQSIEYDLSTIYLCQDELHEKYANKTKSIGVNIC